MKFCKDCKHCLPKQRLFWKDWDNASCWRGTQPSELYPVTGKGFKTLPRREGWCATERLYIGDGHCGPEAKFFEARS